MILGIYVGAGRLPVCLMTRAQLTSGTGWNRTGAAGAEVLNKADSDDPEAAESFWNRLPDT